MNIRFALVSASALVVVLGCVRPTRPSSRVDDAVGTIDVGVSFSGKGTLVGYDTGVMERLVERSRPGAFDNALFTGNSSGSVLAAYFACFGMTSETVAKARDLIRDHPADLVIDSPAVKRRQMVMGTRTETNSRAFRKFTEGLLTGVDGKACVPAHPVIITAANADILDQRIAGRSLLSNKPLIGPGFRQNAGNRVVAPETFVVYETAPNKPSERIRPLGRACTHFVDYRAAAVLARVPESDRLCDTREIKTPRDLVMAVLASVSEGTLFFPVVDADYDNPPDGNIDLLHGELGDPYWQRVQWRAILSRSSPFVLTPLAKIKPEVVVALGGESGYGRLTTRVSECANASGDREVIVNCMLFGHLGLPATTRVFVGGYFHTTPARELKAALPGLVVIGSGRPPLAAGANRLFERWYTVNGADFYRRDRWWLDWEAYPFTKDSPEFNAAVPSPFGDDIALRTNAARVWSALNNVDAFPLATNADTAGLGFEALVALRKSVAYGFGRMMADYRMASTRGASPDTVGPDGQPVVIPTTDRETGARLAMGKLGVNVAPDEFLREARAFLSRADVQRYLSLDGGEAPMDGQDP